MITTRQFIKPCSCRSVGECGHNSFAEYDALDKMVDTFAAQMKHKLHKKAMRGWRGWDDPEQLGAISQAMDGHIKKLDFSDPMSFVDVANFAAMLWNMCQP